MREMEHTFSNIEISKRRQYWSFVIPLTIFLVLMVKFPLRIFLNELLCDTLFYGIIGIICLKFAMRIQRQFGKKSISLVALLMFCMMLSCWQVVDLLVLRTSLAPRLMSFDHNFTGVVNETEGFGWYGLRFRDEDILCHSLFERYYGNRYLAITIEINREASWYACGG